MAIRIEIRRDTAANWTSVNPTLASGEMGFETDTNKIKMGNGTTTWTSLAYTTGVSGFSGFSGYSGTNGTNGSAGTSGFSGFSGISGYSGVDGVSGISGYSGVGTSGFSGFSGYSGAGGAGASATEVSFTNASLTTGVLTVTHSKGLAAGYTAMATIVDNTGNVVIPDAINTFATNSFKVDLTSFGTLTGTWYCLYITK